MMNDNIMFKPFVYTDCTDKTYGVNCQETCGHCKDQSTCAVMDGRCSNGCETWYISDVCKTLIGMSKRDNIT